MVDGPPIVRYIREYEQTYNVEAPDEVVEVESDSSTSSSSDSADSSGIPYKLPRIDPTVRLVGADSVSVTEKRSKGSKVHSTTISDEDRIRDILLNLERILKFFFLERTEFNKSYFQNIFRLLLE